MTYPRDGADVSVIIPARNRADRIGSALQSVARQSICPHEVIVVDDGSSDGTSEIARDLGVTVLRNERSKGAAEARNRGVEHASSSIIAFLDSDDEWEPDHLKRSLEALRDHVFVTSPMIDSFGRARGNLTGRTVAINHESLFFPENAVCTSTVVARRDAIRTAGGFRTFDRAEDLDLWIRMLSVGTAAALGVPTARYFVTASYADPDLADRNRRGTLSVLARYSSEEWLTSRIRKLVTTQQQWDDFRHSTKRDGLRGASKLLTLALGMPFVPLGLWGTFQHRYRARRFAGTSSVNSGTSD